jgi:mRNA interferase MazF
MEVVNAPAVRRGQVFLVDLSPTRGSEIREARPCVVVSPDDLNARSRSFIVAPLTKGQHPYPFRIACRFRGQPGFVVLDQIRAVDRKRLVRRLGRLSSRALASALAVLREMFAP